MSSPRPTYKWPVATALRETLAEGYSWDRFRRDAVAAFVVSLVALPLSMALAIAVGLPPQHGLYTAIVAGVLAPLLGGSKFQVSGPTAAFVVVLAPIVGAHGLHGLIWCQLLAGVFLLIFAAARLGRFISIVPYPVTTGFTAGIAVILGVISLNDLLGMGLDLSQGHFPEKLAVLGGHLGNIDPYAAAVGLAALGFIVYGAKLPLLRHVPSTILGLAAALGLSALFAHLGHPVETIASKFSYVGADGAPHGGIPPYPPSLHIPTDEPRQLFSIPTVEEWRVYVYPALVIALLAALESLLSATVADSMTGGRHNPNAELTGIGAANIAAGLCAGIPATGAIARTAALINSGGTSPFASVMHALLILGYMLALAPMIGHIPMAALAAILVHTAYRMSHWRQFVHTIRIAPRSDILVLLACFLFTVVIDMVAGVAVGMGLAGLLLMKRISKMTHVQLEHRHTPGVLEQEAESRIPPDTLVYRIHGPLFFSTVEKALDQAGYLLGDIKTLVVDMSDVHFIDMSGLVAMRSMVETVTKQGRALVLAGDNTATRALQRKLESVGLSDRVRFAPDLTGALNV